MTTKDNANVRVVTLKDLWGIFIHRLWIIIIAAAAVVGGLFVINRMTFVPVYSSTATLYILRQEGGATSDSSADADFSLALKVVNDCDYLLKSHSVLDEVIQKLDLQIGYKALSESVSTSNPENTRILEVTVESDSPENAKHIVDALCEIGQEKVAEAMGFQQVNLYEYGTLSNKPCNTTSITTYLLAGVIAAILVYSAFLIVFLLDDCIRTEEDIERYLGLSILGNIPNANDKKTTCTGIILLTVRKKKSVESGGHSYGEDYTEASRRRRLFYAGSI